MKERRTQLGRPSLVQRGLALALAFGFVLALSFAAGCLGGQGGQPAGGTPGCPLVKRTSLDTPVGSAGITPRQLAQAHAGRYESPFQWRTCQDWDCPFENPFDALPSDIASTTIRFEILLIDEALAFAGCGIPFVEVEARVETADGQFAYEGRAYLRPTLPTESGPHRFELVLSTRSPDAPVRNGSPSLPENDFVLAFTPGPVLVGELSAGTRFGRFPTACGEAHAAIEEPFRGIVVPDVADVIDSSFEALRSTIEGEPEALAASADLRLLSRSYCIQGGELSLRADFDLQTLDRRYRFHVPGLLTMSRAACAEDSSDPCVHVRFASWMNHDIALPEERLAPLGSRTTTESNVSFRAVLRPDLGFERAKGSMNITVHDDQTGERLRFRGSFEPALPGLE